MQFYMIQTVARHLLTWLFESINSRNFKIVLGYNVMRSGCWRTKSLVMCITNYFYITYYFSYSQYEYTYITIVQNHKIPQAYVHVHVQYVAVKDQNLQ